MLDKENLPKHVAIIMDGNGRWARARKLPRTAGHRKGIQVVEEIVESAAKLGIKVLSLYAFSTENWSRPKSEVGMLMHALKHYLKSKLEKFMKNNIKFKVTGDINKFPENIRELLLETEEKTKLNTGLILNLALNYGARSEIVSAVKKIAEDVASGRLNIDSIDEDKFSQFLYTKELPDPDLLIRTSGEMRISNFMLWQLSYAELYFCKKFWPDFNKNDLDDAISEYQKRERRFGGIHAQAAHN